ncbi:MAG: cell wall-binding repeat-containing protein [Acidimicrobiales bacterium]|nr:cell wall-binding repeat-containing protein [Acidimicrobiales bacterium]
MAGRRLRKVAAALALAATTTALAAVATSPTPAGAEPATWLDHVSGEDRYVTAALLSQKGWPGGAPAAVVVSGLHPADAFAAATLAGAVGGPVLLTPPDALGAVTAAELDRLGAPSVYVVGAPSDAVVGAIQGSGRTVVRLRAGDRYGTADLVVEQALALGADPSTVLVVGSTDAQSALAASALAAAFKLPILLTPPDGGGLADRVARLGAQRVWLIGAAASLPDGVVAPLPGVDRLTGADATTMSAAVADRAVGLGMTGPPLLVSASSYVDGLAAGPVAASRHAPVLLTDGIEMSPAVLDWRARHPDARAVTVVGGWLAIGPLARCQLEDGNPRSLRCAEEELSRQGYHMGVNGRSDTQDRFGLFAFQKVAALPVTGQLDEAGWQRMLQAPPLPAPRRPDLEPDHVEIDLAHQLVLLVRAGRTVNVWHTSTGKPSTPTIVGVFRFYEKRNYRQSDNMYRPSYFIRGYAIHGYPSVPLYPASHGCARVYDGDMDVIWDHIWIGEQVATYR